MSDSISSSNNHVNNNHSSNENPPFKSSYILCIPSHIAEDDRLHGKEILLFGQLAGLSRSCGYAYISNESLIKKIKISENTLQSYLQKLENFGYIKREIFKTFDNKKNVIKTERRIYVACGFIPPVSKNVCDSPIPNSKNVYDSPKFGDSQKKIEKEDSHREKSEFSKNVYDSPNFGEYKEKKSSKENNKQQPYFSNPSKPIPTPQNAAAPFEFSNNILHKIQKKLSTAAAFLDSDIEKLRHELTEAIQDPEKVEVGITWYLSLSKNRRERITKTVGSIICALRDSYAHEIVKSLHNAKEREIEAIEIKQKKQQQEIQQKIDDPVDNALMFKKTVDILSTIDGIRVEDNVIYYDDGQQLEPQYGAFRTVMPNGKIFYGKNGSVKCKFDFNIPRNEFTRGIYWFMEYFKPLLSAN